MTARDRFSLVLAPVSLVVLIACWSDNGSTPTDPDASTLTSTPAQSNAPSNAPCAKTFDASKETVPQGVLALFPGGNSSGKYSVMVNGDGTYSRLTPGFVHM